MQVFEILKENQLFEASFENVEMLKELANSIWNSIPEVEEGQVYENYVSQLRRVDKVFQKYEKMDKFKKAFEILGTTRIRVVNDENYKDRHYTADQGVWGYHSASENLLLIWLSNIMRPEVISIRYSGSAKSTLVHELRHLFQHAEYPEYFKSRQAFRKEYSRQPIEIDAVWTQIIAHDIDVDQFETYPEDYVQEVLGSLMSKKSLTDKEIQHYSRKTLKFYNQYFDKNVEKEWNTLINTWGQYAKTQSTYTVDNFVGDVIEELSRVINRRTNSDLVKKKLLNHYAQETRKFYRTITTEPRNEKRKKAYIDKLIPHWQQIAADTEDQWRDLNVNSVKLTGAIVRRMLDQHIAPLVKDTAMQKELTIWFTRLTRDRIDATRSWIQPKIAASKVDTK